VRARAADGLADAVGHQVPVRQAGQRIVLGAPLQFRLVQPGRRDIVLGDDEMLGIALFIVDGRDVGIDMEHAAVAAPQGQHGIVGTALAHRVDQLFHARLFGHAVDQHLQRPAEDLVRRNAARALEGGIDELDQVVRFARVDNDDGVGARGDRPLVQAHGLRGAFQVGGAQRDQGLDLARARAARMDIDGGGEGGGNPGQQHRQRAREPDRRHARTRPDFPLLPGNRDALHTLEHRHRRQPAQPCRLVRIGTAVTRHLDHAPAALFLPDQRDLDALVGEEV